MMCEWILYGTSACHLCEQAAVLVGPAIGDRGGRWREVDIADDDQLVARYGVRIPVLRHQPTASELGWPFDAETLDRWLDGVIPNAPGRPVTPDR